MVLGSASEPYVAPGEWRGDMAVLKPEVSSTVESKMRRFRWKMLVYGLLVVGVVAWIVLSFTVWGNPSPKKQCSRLIEAVNARDEAGFMELILPGAKDLGRQRYGEITRLLGEGGKIEGAELKVDVLDNYDARGYITSEKIEFIIALENHKGTWYINPSREVTVISTRRP